MQIVFKRFFMKTIKNKIQLIGHVGVDPIMRTFEDGKVVANFTVAVNDRYKNQKGEWIDEVQWFSIVAWSYLAMFADRNLAKGTEVAIEGRLMNKIFFDKNDMKRTAAEIMLTDIVLIGRSNLE